MGPTMAETSTLVNVGLSKKAVGEWRMMFAKAVEDWLTRNSTPAVLNKIAVLNKFAILKKIAIF